MGCRGVRRQVVVRRWVCCWADQHAAKTDEQAPAGKCFSALWRVSYDCALLDCEMGCEVQFPREESEVAKWQLKKSKE
jgi:hypothetical protein